MSERHEPRRSRLGHEPPRLGLRAYITCFKGIVWREVLRYLHQRERFMSALVRPLIWLFIFAAGFRQTLGVSIIPPYETYVLYEVYIVPGLLGMMTSSSSARRPSSTTGPAAAGRACSRPSMPGSPSPTNKTIIVPGHGPTTNRAGMVAYRAMLQAVGEKVRDAVQRGETMTAIVAAGPAAGYEASFGSQSRADQFVQLLVVGFARQGAGR